MKVARGLRAAGLVTTAALLVGGCSSTHPGAAVQIDGYRIPMSTVDAQADALCAIGPTVLLGSPEGEQVDGQNFRRIVAGGQVQLRLAELAAEELALEVPTNDVTVEDLGIDTEGLDSAQTDALLEFYADNTRLRALFGAISEELAGGGAAEGGEAAALELLQAQAEDIDIDPRLGLNADLSDAAASGSLSVPVSDQAQLPSAEDAAGLQSFVAGLPAEQTCG